MDTAVFVRNSTQPCRRRNSFYIHHENDHRLFILKQQTNKQKADKKQRKRTKQCFTSVPRLRESMKTLLFISQKTPAKAESLE